MKRSLAILALCTGFACSGPTPPSEPKVRLDASAEPSAAVPSTKPAAQRSAESNHVRETLQRVSALRGIKPTKDVPSVTLDRAQLVSHVKDKALREYPPEALAREGRLLQVLGFAPSNFDYLSSMLKLLGAQLEGFYEPKNGTMYLAADLEGAEASATLAHELVHALQDQRWDLKHYSDYRPGHSDESIARACLAEGDATSVMLDYLMMPAQSALDVPPATLRMAMQAGMGMSDIQSVPHILRSTLVAPYMDGVTFVHALRRKGGWTAVDRAWSQLPTTTEQILHVEKWEQGENALSVPPPSAAALGEGWKSDDVDTFGELGFALAFSEWMPDEAARLIASGWGGDRSTTFTKGDEFAYAVHLRFDEAPRPAKTDAYAERALKQLTTSLKKNWGKPAMGEATLLCFDRKDFGPLLFARQNREFVMLVGPAKSGSWTSTSTCQLAKKWALEVIAQR